MDAPYRLEKTVSRRDATIWLAKLPETVEGFVEMARTFGAIPFEEAELTEWLETFSHIVDRALETVQTARKVQLHVTADTPDGPVQLARCIIGLGDNASG